MLASLLAFLAFATLGLVGPGIALQRLCGVRVDPAQVLPLGLAFTAGAYWLSLVTGWGWLYPALVALALLALARPRLGLAAGPSLRGALAPALALVGLLALTQYRWNRPAADGAFLLDPLVPFDTAFHVGLSYELTAAYPPQVPSLSGFPLGYHLGTDLVRAAALRWGGVDPYDSISRFDVTLMAWGLLLGLRGIAARLGAPPRALRLASWSLLLTDASFLLGWAPGAHWWTDLLKGNVLVSLAYANPVVPGLTLALGALLALSRHESGEGRGWLALAAAQAFALPHFKVFLGPHLLLGLGVAFLLRRRGSTLVAAAAAAVATLTLAAGTGSRTLEWAFDPLDLVHTPESLGLEPLGLASHALWVLLWIGASLGLRWVGLADAFRSLRGESAAAALAAMALVAWPAGLLFRVSAPEALPGQQVVNDLSYLVEQGGPILWLFAALALARWHPRTAVLAVILCALPSTLQFAVKKALEPPDPIPAPMVRAMAALRAASRPGDVALQRPSARYPAVPVVLAGRRVPYERFTPYLTQFASRAALEARHEAVHRFFRTHDASEARAIAESLGARYLCLYDGDRVRFPTEGLLERVYEEPEARVYRFSR